MDLHFADESFYLRVKAESSGLMAVSSELTHGSVIGPLLAFSLRNDFGDDEKIMEASNRELSRDLLVHFTQGPSYLPRHPEKVAFFLHSQFWCPGLGFACRKQVPDAKKLPH